MTRLFASVLLVVGLSHAAIAQTPTPQNQPATTNTQQTQPSESTQAPQNILQSLRQRLTSAGFSDVNIVPSSFLITARDRIGRPVMMRITPNSMFLLTEIPAASESTTGSGTEGQGGQQQRQQ